MAASQLSLVYDTLCELLNFEGLQYPCVICT